MTMEMKKHKQWAVENGNMTNNENGLFDTEHVNGEMD